MFSRKNVPKKPTRVMMQQNIMRRQAHELSVEFPELDTVIDTFTENHQLNLTELRDLLKKCHLKLSDSALERLLPPRVTRFNFGNFLVVVKEALANRTQTDQLDQILNAFVALGGNPDHSGSVQKSILINIVRKQFELTFNIEEFLDTTTDGNELDYNTFSKIFQQAIEHSTHSRMGSATSARTNFDTAVSVKVGEEGLTSRIEYTEFENWLSENYK